MSQDSTNNGKAINPYAFINVPDKKTISEQAAGTYTGKIECRIYPRTPLFIPNTTNKFAFSKRDGEHLSYDFFSYNDISGQKDPPCAEPVIPGSSIRGEIRALYETLTGSCLSTVSNKLFLYKRLPNPGEMGILKIEIVGGRQKATLYQAERYMACYKIEGTGKDKAEKYFNGKHVGKFLNVLI